MLQSVEIQNFKSIEKLKLELGRINVFIGENSSGKTNILEGIGFGIAAGKDKLENEFLTSRGIRVTSPKLMRAGFNKQNISENIIIKYSIQSKEDNDVFFINCEILNKNQPYSPWKQDVSIEENNILHEKKADYHYKGITRAFLKTNIIDYTIFSPENSYLRQFEQEGQIEPLGIKGEGLFKLLRVLTESKETKILNEIKNNLKMISWFEDFDIPDYLYEGERRISIKDKYLDLDNRIYDQKSANEGFLFLLFYFSLFISELTPKFFAIDNIEASLNPKLCTELMIKLAELAKKYDKQAIFTTHNPAILDGMDLNDDEQRLFVIKRNKKGHTIAKRIKKPETPEGEEPVKLSELFMRGVLGGLPTNF